MQFFKIPSGTAKKTKDALDEANQRIASFFTAPKHNPFVYTIDEATHAFIMSTRR